jgi:hypothetical protein
LKQNAAKLSLKQKECTYKKNAKEGETVNQTKHVNWASSGAAHEYTASGRAGGSCC